MIKITRLIIAFIILFSVSLHSSVIKMKNGDTFKGEIIDQDSKIIRLKIQNNIIKVYKKNIKHIYFKKTNLEYVNIYLKNKKIIKGLIIEQDKHKIVLKKNNKTIVIYKKNIERQDWKKIPDKLNKQIKAEYEKDRIRIQSLWRSAVLPSWGQFYQGKKLKAGIIAAAVAGSITGLIISYIKHNDYYNQYNDGNHSPEIKNNVNKWKNFYTGFIISTISIWIYNIIDAAVFAPDKLNNKKNKLTFHYSQNKNFCIELNNRF